MSGTAVVWLRREVVEAVHDEQIAWRGGQYGISSGGLLESAVVQPRNLAADGDPDMPALAASLDYGIARNHPFLDGSKRTAFVCAEAFLLLNGLVLTAGDADCVLTIERLAEGSLCDAEFAAGIRAHAAR